MSVCACGCVCVYVLIIVFRDKILHFINNYYDSFHPCVTIVAHTRPLTLSFFPRCRWQVTGKDVYTLRSMKSEEGADVCSGAVWKLTRE